MAATLKASEEDRIGEGNTLVNIAGTQIELNHYLEALETSQGALKIFREFNNTVSEVSEVKTLLNLTYICLMLERVNEAIEYNNQALELAHTLEITSFINMCEQQKEAIERMQIIG